MEGSTLLPVDDKANAAVASKRIYITPMHCSLVTFKIIRYNFFAKSFFAGCHRYVMATA